jgi:uncharacterized membrane protein YfcA
VIALVGGLSVLVGLALGLLGGGGSILMLPLLVYVAGVTPAAGVTMSLLAIGATSAVALVPHARAGRVQWKTGLTFGVAGMAGAFLGALLSGLVPPWATLSGFALLMLWTGWRMLGSTEQAACTGSVSAGSCSTSRALLQGALVGVLAGLVGAGGGFLVVPALALFGGLAMREAIGTSLLVIAMQSSAGFVSHIVQHVDVDWRLAFLTTLTAIAGSVIGARVSTRVPQESLRRAFGGLVVVLGVFVLCAQLWPSLGA